MGRAATIYAEQLNVFSHGHALWFPEPVAGADGVGHEVTIGDVGYIDEDGAFNRLFNITYQKSHALNTDGVPDGFDPFPFDHNRSTIVKHNCLHPGPICSKSVKRRRVIAEISGDAAAASVGAGVAYQFQCARQEGALLILMDSATKTSLKHDDTNLQEYMRKHHDNWYKYATDLGVRCEPEDLVLVRGTTKTSAWAVAAFLDAETEAHDVVFNGHIGNIGKATIGFSQDSNVFSSFEHRIGPASQDQPPLPDLPHGGGTDAHTSGQPPGPQPPANQCVFVQYYKLVRRLLWKKKLIAKAGGAELPRADDEGVGSALVVEPDSTVRSPRSPLDDIVDYIFENGPAEVALVSHSNIDSLLLNENLSAPDMSQFEDGYPCCPDISQLLQQRKPRVAVTHLGTGILLQKMRGDKAEVDQTRVSQGSSIEAGRYGAGDSNNSVAVSPNLPEHWRTKLNNLVQRFGVEYRLEWNCTPGKLLLTTSWIALAIINHNEYGRGVASSVSKAKEEAARQAYNELYRELVRRGCIRG